MICSMKYYSCDSGNQRSCLFVVPMKMDVFLGHCWPSRLYASLQFTGISLVVEEIMKGCSIILECLSNVQVGEEAILVLLSFFFLVML